MPATDVEICNLALMRAGDSTRIDGFAQNTKQSNACGLIYPTLRDEMLEAFPWSFSTRHTALALSAEVARSGWSLVYDLPSDCLFVRYLWAGIRNPRPEQRVPFRLEARDDGKGRVLLTDQEDAELVWTKRISYVAAFSAHFADTLAWLLAAELVIPLALSPTAAEKAFKMAQQKWAMAVRVDAAQQQEDPPLESEFIAARAQRFVVPAIK